VSGATQSSFLQQVVHLDMQNKRLNVLGEINKRFVVSPDVEALLAATENEASVKHLTKSDGEDPL
jgi:DNA-directed RNA polymerase III subunit RPC4